MGSKKELPTKLKDESLLKAMERLESKLHLLYVTGWRLFALAISTGLLCIIVIGISNTGNGMLIMQAISVAIGIIVGVIIRDLISSIKKLRNSKY